MVVMRTTTQTLYDTGFAEGTARMAELLRQGRFDALAAENDIENLAEEIDDLGKSERAAAGSRWRGSRPPDVTCSTL